MKKKQASPFISKSVWTLFRVHAHLLIAWGLEDAKSKIRTDDEEEITGIIHREIKDILRSGRTPWCSHYSAHNEEPIPEGEREGKARRKIDLIIEYVTAIGHPEYIFEAKPLNYPKKYQRMGNYTGGEGLGRFIVGEYADYTINYPEVGMLGYVLSDKPEQWRDRLQEAIDRKKTELCLRSPQRDIDVIDAFPLEWISEHERESSKSLVTVYHILLDCRY